MPYTWYDFCNFDPIAEDLTRNEPKLVALDIVMMVFAGILSSVEHPGHEQIRVARDRIFFDKLVLIKDHVDSVAYLVDAISAMDDTVRK